MYIVVVVVYQRTRSAGVGGASRAAPPRAALPTAVVFVAHEKEKDVCVLRSSTNNTSSLPISSPVQRTSDYSYYLKLPTARPHAHLNQHLIMICGWS